KLQMFNAGVAGSSVVVLKGRSPTSAAWDWMKEEEPEQFATHERCADFMAGPGGMAELAKTDPERAAAIAHHHDWMARNDWSVEAWFGDEGERRRKVWGYKPRSKAAEKRRKAMLRKMIDAGVFGPPAMDGRCHEW